MGEDVESINDLSKMFTRDASTLKSDEDLAIHIMHQFNIDVETLETLPAFEEPLRPLLWPNKQD